MTLPYDSPEVEAEALEISTALAVELKADSASYADCFRNTENRNAWRTWTGILMQGVSTYPDLRTLILINLWALSGNNSQALTSFVSSFDARFLSIMLIDFT